MRAKLTALTLCLLVTACVPGTRNARTYDDKMTGATRVVSGDSSSNFNMFTSAWIGFRGNVLNGVATHIHMDLMIMTQNWHFWEDLWIKMGDEIVKFENVETDRTVLNDARTQVSGTVLVSRQFVEQFAMAESVLIRFIAREGYLEGTSSERMHARAASFLTELDRVVAEHKAQ